MIGIEQRNWGTLNTQQVGRYGEYLVKMLFVRAGFDVFGAEVDDKGIDFVLRQDGSPPSYFDVQVKTVRPEPSGYVFLRKSKFPLMPNRLLALVRLTSEPRLYVIHAPVWRDPGRPACFVDRPYEGLKSEPEWGLNLSKRGWQELERYAFDERRSLSAAISSVGGRADGRRPEREYQG